MIYSDSRGRVYEIWTDTNTANTINVSPVDSRAESINTQGMPEVMLTVTEVMTRLSLSRQNVYDAIKQGRLRGAKDPETRTWLIYESSVLAYRKPQMGRPPKRRKGNSG